MNRNPVVSAAPSIDFPLFTSTMAIHFWILARLRPSRCVMRSPSYSPIFCLDRNDTLVNRPRPSMPLGLTSIGTGHLVLRAEARLVGGIRRVEQEAIRWYIFRLTDFRQLYKMGSW